ncbi:hypothetical protein MZO42_11585 [Sphingomonas psychrotolerans]|uniref:Uncharacterized protein n=1 Tax=Sphingomonas psychrotolerans TaxID=1327635 RepID=A0ABU3N481_9SPHN|nr:DUF6624 domain-containing protein [Sphingomonas psychrotolerans]MDT8759340.1 hypothetical protein [Sphingomonas psychrotolerans]
MLAGFLYVLLSLSHERANDDAAGKAIAVWTTAVGSERARKLSQTADRDAKIMRLVRLDEVARQYLWVVDDPRLSSLQREKVMATVGPLLLEVDSANTAELQALLPPDGWFRNSRDGNVITHGAWLIVQHTPDRAFRNRILPLLKERVLVGDIDPRDYALTYDRVQILEGRKQRYGSQARCNSLGYLDIENVEDVDRVNQLRAEIGWAQTLEETKGDLGIGKPC